MRKCGIHLYRTEGVEFPPNSAIHKGRKLGLASIFKDAGMHLKLYKALSELPLLANNAAFDLGALQRYMTEYWQPQLEEWHAFVLIVPKIAYLVDYQIIHAAGVMFDYGDNSTNSRPREGCAIAFNKIGNNDLLYIRTLAHEIGHLFNLLHPLDHIPQRDITGTIMDTFGDLLQSDLYPHGMKLSFSDQDSAWLQNAPESSVQPGGDEFRLGGSTRSDMPINIGKTDADEVLRFMVSTRNNTFLQGDLVELRLSLQNTAKRSVQVDPSLEIFGDSLKVWVVDPQGRRQLFQPIMKLCQDTKVGVELQRGEEILRNTIMSFGRFGQVFDSPGIYSVEATYLASIDGGRTILHSNKHELEIRAPSTEHEVEFVKLMKNSEVTLFTLCRGGILNRSLTTAMKYLASQHTGSVIAQQMRMAIAQHSMGSRHAFFSARAVDNILKDINEENLDYEQKAELSVRRAFLNRLLGEHVSKERNMKKYVESACICRPDVDEMSRDIRSFINGN